MERLRENLPFLVLGAAVAVGLGWHLFGQTARLGAPGADPWGERVADARTHTVRLSAHTVLDVYRPVAGTDRAYLLGRWGPSGSQRQTFMDALPGPFHSVRTVRTDAEELLAVVYGVEGGGRGMRLYRFRDVQGAAGVPVIDWYGGEDVSSAWDFHAASCAIASSGEDRRNDLSGGTTYNYLAPGGVDARDNLLRVSEFINSPQDYLCVRGISGPLAEEEYEPGAR